MKSFLILCAGLIIGLTGIKAQDAWWPLNANADDSVGTQDGTANGGVSFVNDPIRGQVMKLDGDSGFVHLPLGLLENVDEVTITCYFKWSGGANWQRIYSLGNALPNVRTLYLCPRDGWAGNNIHLTLGGPYGKWTDLNPEPIHSDIWYFAAVVKKSDSLILYLNDKVIASDTSFLTPGDLYPDSANYLGKSHWNDPTFNGMIDDVKLYKSALTKEEVMGLYTPQYEDAYWPLDVNADDALGTEHGITNGGVSFVNDPIRGQVMKLDGDSGFVHLPLGLLENVDEATITCYFNWSGGANWQRVYSFGNANPNVRTLYLCPRDGWAGNNIHLTLGGPYGKWTDLNPEPIHSDIWYFAAVVKKSDSLILYLNDKVIASDTSFLTPGDLYPDSANYLGKSHWNDPTFNGMIDDVRLFKSALTKEEVMALYTPQYEDAYWPLDVNADDALGTQHGVTNGGVSFVTDPIRGQVMKLDGDSGFVHLPLGLLENVDEATITCYFNWSGGADWQRVYSFGNANPNVRTLYLCPRDGWAGNNIHLTLGGPYGKWTDLNPRAISPDIWYFAAVVKKADSLILYLNDQVIASDTSFLTPGDLYPDSANYLGKSHWNDPTFNGLIDDVRLYKSALTKAEVLKLFKPLYKDAYWPLDANANDVYALHNGIINEGVSFVTDPIRGQVMQLDGTTGFVHLPLGLVQDVDDVTIIANFNFAGGGNWQRVYSFGNALPNVRTLYLCPKDGSGNLHVTLGGPFGLWRDYSPVQAVENRWYFSAFVKKADSLLFYLDDKVIVADTFMTVPADLYPDSANYLGKSHWNDPLYNGMIDDVRFITRALTKEEIMAFYTEVPTGINTLTKSDDEPLIYAVRNQIVVKLNDNGSDNAELSVFDVLGKRIFYTRNLSELNYVSFRNGIYLVSVVRQGKMYTRKVIIF